ncbi:MAG: hypothetical protein ABEN55_16515 [Bradymonadaceae bacterium]
MGCPPTDGDGDAGDAGDNKPSWKQAFQAHDRGWLLSVAGRSADAMYAVGGELAGDGDPEDGLMMRRGADRWREVELPEDVPLLTWVHVFEDGTPVVAGNQGTILWKRDGEWVRESTPTDQNLWGVWGASPDDVWAVGGNGTADDGTPTVLRYVGSSWSSVELPDLEHVDVFAFFKVWGTGPDNVFIVGQRGIVLRWNGEKLVEQFTGTNRDLISLWGTGPDNIAAIGGRATGVLAQWDGQEWTSQSLSPLPGMNGIWMPSPNRAWVAGVRGHIVSLDLEAPLENQQITRIQTRKNFHAIYGLPGTGLFAVGGTLTNREGPYQGIAKERAFAE